MSRGKNSREQNVLNHSLFLLKSRGSTDWYLEEVSEYISKYIDIALISQENSCSE